ncbi:Schwann cell myelin protein [Microcaecilia unicolor]|uniref:Schwann cell myelin protein-like n=1 Tax=Microcaecilia unicolor TaxID=1415580 RepID=A0A6P7YKL4_9AMPH|nr:Schwann cell myelin protein-like [Microcaecilia unicolor]
MKLISFIKELVPEGTMDFLSCVFILMILQASFQASFTQTWSSWQPASIQALNGSCVVIPCHFTYPGHRRTSKEFSAAWYLYRGRGYPEVYNSKNPVQGVFKGRTSLSGDLGNSICSLKIDNVRHSDGDTYYTWIDPDSNGFRFYDTTTRVTVTDAPKKPSLNFSAVMSEGESVTINCFAEHTCPPNPPSLTLDWPGIKARVYEEEFSGDSWRTVISFTYFPSSEDHGKHLQCSATYPNGQRSQGHITLHINYPPKDTIISIVGSGEPGEGDSINMTCSTHANPEVTTYSWYQGLEKVLITGETQKNITIRNLRRDNSPYYCSAQNYLGTRDSPPLVVRVQYKPVIMPGPRCHFWGGAVMCNCTADGYPPPVVEWHFPNLNVGRNEGLQASSSANGNMITSVLTGRTEQLFNISCSASNSQGITMQYVTNVTKGDTRNQMWIISGALGGAFLILLILGCVFYRMHRKTKRPELQIYNNSEQENPAREKQRTTKAEHMNLQHVNYCKPEKKKQVNTYNTYRNKQIESITDEDYENIEVLQIVSEQIYSNV